MNLHYNMGTTVLLSTSNFQERILVKNPVVTRTLFSELANREQFTLEIRGFLCQKTGQTIYHKAGWGDFTIDPATQVFQELWMKKGRQKPLVRVRGRRAKS